MKKVTKDDGFKRIAKSLGIVIPASLLCGTANATPISAELPSDKQLLEQFDKRTASNEVINRLSLFGSNSYENNVSAVHSNSHTNAEGNHTNQHENTNHGDYHTNNRGYNSGTACYEHANNHSNTPQSSSHTNFNNPHTNNHSDNPNC
ncbi:MAG: hypothetical protein LBM06_03920 [Prevotellaceae bacterium]|nr:hypothetical protein [Prevotellaceae bacterium]